MNEQVLVMLPIVRRDGMTRAEDHDAPAGINRRRAACLHPLLAIVRADPRRQAVRTVVDEHIPDKIDVALGGTAFSLADQIAGERLERDD